MIRYLDQEDVGEVKKRIMKIVGDYKPRKFGLKYFKAKLDVSEAVIIEALETLVENDKLVQREFGPSEEPLYHKSNRA